MDFEAGSVLKGFSFKRETRNDLRELAGWLTADDGHKQTSVPAASSNRPSMGCAGRLIPPIGTVSRIISSSDFATTSSGRTLVVRAKRIQVCRRLSSSLFSSGSAEIIRRAAN